MLLAESTICCISFALKKCLFLKIFINNTQLYYFSASHHIIQQLFSKLQTKTPKGQNKAQLDTLYSFNNLSSTTKFFFTKITGSISTWFTPSLSPGLSSNTTIPVRYLLTTLSRISAASTPPNSAYPDPCFIFPRSTYHSITWYLPSCSIALLLPLEYQLHKGGVPSVLCSAVSSMPGMMPGI